MREEYSTERLEKISEWNERDVQEFVYERFKGVLYSETCEVFKTQLRAGYENQADPAGLANEFFLMIVSQSKDWDVHARNIKDEQKRNEITNKKPLERFDIWVRGRMIYFWLSWLRARGKSTKREVPLIDSGEEVQGSFQLAEGLVSPHPPPETESVAIAERRQLESLRTMVEEFCSTLPDGERVALQKVEIEGREPSEGATELGISDAALRTRLCRARLKVRAFLMANGYTRHRIHEILQAVRDLGIEVYYEAEE